MNSHRLLKTKSNHFYTPFHACHIHSHGCEFSWYVPLREKFSVTALVYQTLLKMLIWRSEAIPLAFLLGFSRVEGGSVNCFIHKQLTWF